MGVRRLGNHVVIEPTRRVEAELRLPGSKSHTQRLLVCSALADGESRLERALFADDTRIMIEGLRACGFSVAVDEREQRIAVAGRGGHIPADEADIDAGNAGTAMRFLTALACLGYGKFRVDGSPRMRERPIAQLVDGLHQMGAAIGYDGRSGYPPVTVVARGLGGGQVRFESPPSSQYVSAILMVAPLAARDVMIRIGGAVTSLPYVDMTVATMRELGADVLHNDHQRYVVPAGQRYRAGTYAVEPDASTASYFFAGAGVTGGRVRIYGLSRRSIQGDVGFVDVLGRMGCRVEESAAGTPVEDEFIEVSGPDRGGLRGVDEDLNAMPDLVQTLAVTALFAEGPTTVRNVGNLRIKETDRLKALTAELTKLGARVDTAPDAITIHPPRQLTAANIETYDDHRMAMSFAVAGLAAQGVTIRDPDCVSKSFPEFFEYLARL